LGGAQALTNHTATARLIVNALGFQAVWFAWAWGAPAGEWVWPALLSALYVGQHLRFSLQRRADVRAILVGVLVGALLDTTLLQMQWLTFALPNPEPLQSVQPGWMTLMWASLACTLHTSLRWLQGLSWWAYPISGVFGFLAYAAADHLGALTMANSPWPVLVLVVFWAAFIPWAQRWSASTAKQTAKQASKESV
jgi:hypothetical protein